MNEPIWQDYHKHTSLSNVYTKDSPLIHLDYWNELKARYGDKPCAYTTVEHGWAGNYFKTYDDLEKFNKKNGTNIKFVFGYETYWVKDRHTDDKSNCHMILLARNDNGRKALNKILSIANKDGYYYRPRLDLELIMSLPPDDVMICTSCIAYWNKYKDIDSITAQLASKFPYFYLEVQPHHTQQQADLNRHILELSSKLNVPIIAGCDSHVIFESQMKDRDDLLESAHISYEDEDGWFMDFPTYDILFSRFQQQGILSDEQIKQAIDNTNALMDFEDIILDRSLKVPVIKSLRNKALPERNDEFERIVWDEWEKQKWDINEAKHDEYIEEINDAINEIEACNMADYFILSYYVMKNGQEKYGGILTPTGRGSAVGMYINKLLRLTKVDKVNSSVEMYPERFLTKERVLESHTPPDVDNNVSSRNEFIQAQKDLIGELGTYDLLALGTLKAKAAWKMYARANGIDPQVANKVSYQIGDYEQAKKHADNPDDVNIEDFIASEFKDLFEGCKRYLGIYDNRKAHPCGCLAYSGDAEADIGVILCKSEATGNEVLTAVIESGTIDAFGYLKQDYLIVDSIGLTYDIYKEIGIEPYTVNQLLDKIKTDDATWNIYRDGFTQCVNQCEQAKSTQKVMRYKPKNISELTQFIAGIRPGFQSMYHLFESRQHFEYGIKALDDLIQDEYRTSSFIIYQEDLMKVLEFAGFPMAETYTIIKAISKKKDHVIKEAKPKFISGFAKAIMDTGETDDESKANELAEKVWHIVEDNSAYGFNCVSGDTIIYKPGWNKQHPLLTVEEMYRVMHDREYAVATGHKNLHDKYRRYGYGFGLSMKDGLVFKNKIVDIYKQPQAMTYLITTESGRNIKATENHKFPTTDGIKTLGELKIGDMLYAKGEYKQSKCNSRLTNSFEPNFPSKGQCGFQKRPDGDSVVFERCKEQHEVNKDSCELCNRPYGEMRFELHHIDFDRTHNEESNYQWLCCSCHKKLHYKNGRTKVFEKGLPIVEDKIVSIEPVGVETVYDIEMSGDVVHNFVLANGLVTCNSAHAYCMAIDSVTIAYLKAHYPLEFYKCVLQRFSNKGEKDKVSLIKQEAIKRGIAIKEIKFGDDNRQFNIDHEHNAIVQNMAGIKNMPKATPQALYELSQSGIKTRTQLYQALMDDSRINSKAIDILFKLDYFSAFAHPNRLLAEFEIYSKYIDAKVVSKKNLTEEQIDILKNLGAKETATQFRNFGNMELIKALIKSKSIPKTSIYQRIKWQIEFLGYSTLNDPSIDPSYWIVVDIKSGPYERKDATLYNVCYGVTREYRLNKKFNIKHEMQPLTLIQAVVNEKPKMKKNEYGSFSVVPNEFVKEVKCWKEFEIK